MKYKLDKTEIKKMTAEEKEKAAWKIVAEKCDDLPVLKGGLDHAEHHKNGVSITFHDRGMNYKGNDILVNLATEKVTVCRFG